MHTQKLSAGDFWTTMTTFDNGAYHLDNERCHFTQSEHMTTLHIYDREKKNVLCFSFNKATFCLIEPEIFCQQIMPYLDKGLLKTKRGVNSFKAALTTRFGYDLWFVSHWRVENNRFIDDSNRYIIG